MEIVIILIVLALVLLFLEIFLPGGVLAMLAGLLIIGASAISWQDYGWMAGAGVFVGSTFLAVVCFFLEIQLFSPKRFGGKLLLTSQVDGSSRKPAEDGELVGLSGDVVSALRPSGKVSIGGRIWDARSESGWIEAGEAVRVERCEVFHLIVSRNGGS